MMPHYYTMISKLVNLGIAIVLLICLYHFEGPRMTEYQKV